ncbi:MAG: helix-turn-helix transcriptional regulator [Erysipelotrichaceae bacterium]|nr:helix-turn-helix transcriptional regulator [Erysipelotrichaceae bacterium]
MSILEKNYPVIGNLRIIMDQKSISVKALSEKSGIAVDVLEKILYNKKVIEPFETVLLAKALETDVNALFKEP